MTGKLSRGQITGRALELCDAQGLQALTIRRLAADLGVTPMALYWHFKNKDELVAGVADHLMARFAPESANEGDGTPWNERLRALAAGMIGTLRRHPCARQVLEQADWTAVPAFLAVWDRTLGLVRQAGFSDAESGLISHYLLRSAIDLAGLAEEAAPPTPEAAELRRIRRLRVRALPGDRYPNIIRASSCAFPDPERGLGEDFGIDLLVGGIESMAARRSG